MQQTFSNLAQGVEFSLRLFGLLREEGVKLGTLQTLTCTRAIAALKIVHSNDLLRVYRTTLINRSEDFAPLQRLFALLLKMYFTPSELSGSELKLLEAATLQRDVALGDSDDAVDTDEDAQAVQGYSVHEVDHHKDFRFMTREEFPAVLKRLEQIARQHAALVRRKSKQSKHGRIVDLRSSIRQSVRYDGEIFNWRYKRKTPTHTRLTVLVDVSGSMEVYSVFLLNFMHLINQNKRFKIEVFVFSTELQPLTQYFRLKNFRSMLADASTNYSGWSGGTKIGKAIETLNKKYAASVNARTLVTIMSDGWDTGDVEILDREMAQLRRRAKSIMWINPLKGDPQYEPIATGMATALPHCDEFISGHSIDALEKLSGAIS